MPTKALVLRLPPDDFARLEAEARKLGVRPGTAARILLRERLAEDEEQRRRARALQALAELRALFRDAGPLDAVRMIEEGREELEARGTRQP